MKIWIILLFSLCLCGCISSRSTHGTQIDGLMVAKIEKGKTTKSDILRWFGIPLRILDAGSGKESEPYAAEGAGESANQEIYIYEYSVEHIRANFFFTIDFNHEKQNNSLMIWIDRETGTVQDYKYRQ